MRKPSHGTVVAYVALFFALSGTAAAATGHAVILGRSNSADLPTAISNVDSGTGPALKLHTATSAIPNLTVSNTAKITRLNADLLDGLSSASFARHVHVTLMQNAPVQAPNGHWFWLCPADAQFVGDFDNATGTVIVYRNVSWPSNPPAGYRVGINYPGADSGQTGTTPPGDSVVTLCLTS